MAAPTVESQRSSAEIAILIECAEGLLRNGDIASARLLLNRAAADGTAQAAFALGRAFDAQFLRRRGALGVDANETQARDWYERASKLGSAEATVHFKRLAAETARDEAH
jgi:TPR repeat protein